MEGAPSAGLNGWDSAAEDFHLELGMIFQMASHRTLIADDVKSGDRPELLLQAPGRPSSCASWCLVRA